MVKIDNVPTPARTTRASPTPTSCIEEIINGRATRFAAVFHSQGADPLGPIRSGRTQDILLFSSFNSPLFVWSGGNPGVTRLIDESTLVNMGPNHAEGYFRGPGGAPHNLYNSTDAIWLQTPPDHPGPPASSCITCVTMRRSPATRRPVSPSTSAAPGSTGSGTRRRSKFDRSQSGTLHVDKTYGQIAATNVIIMGVEYKPSVVDRDSPEAQTVGDGPVFVFSDGQFIEGSWKRELRVLPDPVP